MAVDEQTKRSRELGERLTSRVFDEPLTSDSDAGLGLIIGLIFILAAAGIGLAVWVHYG